MAIIDKIIKYLTMETKYKDCISFKDTDIEKYLTCISKLDRENILNKQNKTIYSLHNSIKDYVTALNYIFEHDDTIRINKYKLPPIINKTIYIRDWIVINNKITKDVNDDLITIIKLITLINTKYHNDSYNTNITIFNSNVLKQYIINVVDILHVIYNKE